MLDEKEGRPTAAADLEIRADGGVRVFNGRATDELRTSEQRVLLEAAVAVSVLRLLESATAIAKATQYFGDWQFGIAAVGVRGAVSFAGSQRMMSSPEYSADEYRRTTTASHLEVIHGADIAERLLMRLLRGLDSPFELTEYWPTGLL